jgi:hypothetical protein
MLESFGIIGTDHFLGHADELVVLHRLHVTKITLARADRTFDGRGRFLCAPLYLRCNRFLFTRRTRHSGHVPILACQIFVTKPSHRLLDTTHLAHLRC